MAGGVAQKDFLGGPNSAYLKQFTISQKDTLLERVLQS